MKKIISTVVLLLTTISLIACGSKEVTPDYTTKEAETALNEGKDLTGKTVEITVDTLVPDGTFGYTIQTGEHLNFVSSENPNVSEGDKILVKVTKIQNVMGSFILTFEKQ